MTNISLSDEQATQILVEGTSRNLYESGGSIPQDEKVRLKDATDLIEAAEAAFRNGNKSENVSVILNIAQNSPVTSTPSAEIAPKVEASPVQGFDITQVSDGVLEGLIIGLDKFPNNENVENERKAYIAEKERRAGAKGQEISQAEAPGEAPEKAGEISAEGSDPQLPVGGEVLGGVGGQDGATGDGTGIHAGQDSAQGEDAGAFARAQTPETSKEEKVPKAKAVEEDGERSEIEARLTLPICKAHNVDLTKLLEISTEQLKFIVDNPDGPPQKEEAKMPVSEHEVETSAVAKDGKSVGGIAPDVAVPEQVISKADLGLEVDESESSGGISAEREKLESLLGGTILKAYGRGRKEIPNIGDNELRFMILNPDGKVSPEELNKAKALDNPNSSIEVAQETDEDGKARELYEQAEAAAEAAPSVEVSSPVKQEQVPVETGVSAPTQIATQSGTEATNKEAGFPEIIGPPTWKNEGDKTSGQNRAMEIISREAMPIPPSYADEQAPKFPMDVSIISRDELFSLHARYHAYEIRMNYVLMEHEDKLNDCIKLRKYREAVVAKSIPFMGEDGKRNTNEYRSAQVDGDQEVLELGLEEHEKKKTVIDLKILRDDYHLCCERLSRQMSKYETERLDAPR